VDFGASGLPCFVNVSWLSISGLANPEQLPLELLQGNYTTGFAPRAKARAEMLNSSRLVTLGSKEAGLCTAIVKFMNR
jgi:hypothetical protein